MRYLLSLALCCAVWTGLPVMAADPVTEAITAAYVPYRAALFRTNSKAQAESALAIAQAQQAWQALSDRYGARPPVPYDRDPDFAASLDAVRKVYAQAADEIGQGRLTQAHETLELARDLMADLRRRNGVIAYSDHMNAYHLEMEQVLQQEQRLTGSPQGLLTLIKQVGVLEYLAGRLRSEAPKHLQDQPGFAPALVALEASVAALQRAAMAQDVAAVREALGRLKGPYSRMFLNFG